MKGCHSIPSTPNPFKLDLEELLYPGQIFNSPQQVVEHRDLTIDEKRAILASWASDACAVEAAPALRRPPGMRRLVTVDEILETLRTLDVRGAVNPSAARPLRQVRRGSGEEFGTGPTRDRGPISAMST